MRNRPGHRLLAALLGLWFVLAGQEPPFAHPCLMAPRSASASVAAVEHHTSRPVSAGAHSAHGPHAAHSGHQQAPDAPIAECECIGDCCCVVPVPTVPQIAVVDLLEAADAESAAPDGPTAERAPDAPSRRQPFAIGPPNTPVA